MTKKDTPRREALAERLREARRARRFTQKGVAKALDLNREAVGLIERGTRDVGALELERFAELYQLELSFFLMEPTRLLPSEGDPVREDLGKVLSALPRETQREVLRYAEYLRDRGA